MVYLFKKEEFVNRLRNMGKHKTKYRNGAWGQHDGDLWYFDCICMIKALLWGWTGDLNHAQGGAIYASNGVPDKNEEQMLDYCSDLSTDLSKIEIGEYLWMPGHCGIYIGDGYSIECTPTFGGGIEITTIPGYSIEGYYQRKWTKHGKLKWIDYSEIKKEETKKAFFPAKGYFGPGDENPNIGKIAEFMYKTFPTYTSKNALGNYYGPYIQASIKEFQKRAKAEGNYNDAVDGCVGPVTLESLKKYGFKED